MVVCGTCGGPELPDDSKTECRPYGPGGSDICFRCAFRDEESEARTAQNFEVILEATEAAGLLFVIGEPPNG